MTFMTLLEKGKINGREEYSYVKSKVEGALYVTT